MASIQRREVERVAVDKATGEKRQVRAVVYRARYRDEGGKEHAGHFQRKVDAQCWLDVSGLGIIVTAASLVVMPVLGVAKKRLGAVLDSGATAGEDVQNLICAAQAGAVLLGLAGTAALGWTWLDPAIALLLAGWAIREGREAWRGDDCCGPQAPTTSRGGLARLPRRMSPLLTDVRLLATVRFHVRSQVHPDLTLRKGRSPMGGARSERHDGASSG